MPIMLIIMHIIMIIMIIMGDHYAYSYAYYDYYYHNIMHVMISLRCSNLIDSFPICFDGAVGFVQKNSSCSTWCHAIINKPEVL